MVLFNNSPWTVSFEMEVILCWKNIFLFMPLLLFTDQNKHEFHMRHPRSVSLSVVLDIEMALRRLGIWNDFGSSVFMKCQNMFILPRFIAALPCCWPMRRVLWSETSILARYVEWKSQGIVSIMLAWRYHHGNPCCVRNLGRLCSKF